MIRRLLNMIFGADGGVLPQTTPQTPPTGRVVEAAGSNSTEDDSDWRRLSGDNSRDLSPLAQGRMRDTAFYLWQANVLANRLIEIPLAYLLGEGVTLKPTGEDQQEQRAQVLTDFWKHPINQLDITLERKLRELGLFGELALPAFVNPVDGTVQLGYLDPQHIETVVYHSDNPALPIGIVTVADKKGVKRRYRTVFNGPESLMTAGTQAARESFTDGDIFYFAVNQLAGDRRGRSDLSAVADWADAYDQFLFNELDRANLMRAFFWDVECAGSTEEQLREKAKKVKAPKPGSVRLHNESEKWTPQSPTLNAADSGEAARLFRNHALGAQTMPEHWFGGGGDVNRATGDSMSEPTFKAYSMRQRAVKHLLEAIGTFVLRQHYQARERGELDWNDPRTACEAAFPELTARDTTKYAAALAQVVTGCAMAIDKGVMTEETAVALIAAIAGRLGVEVDAANELADARRQADATAEKNRFTGPDAAAVAAAMGGASAPAVTA